MKLPPGVKAPRVLPGAGPPTRYLVEFTVGPYLYFISGQSDAAAKAKFTAGAKQYYDRVKGLNAS